MRKFVALLSVVFLIPLTPAHSVEPYQVTVMSRNLYLGSDVGVAMKLLPDFPAAAQFMWDQVRKTDFSTRVKKLAGEAAREKPDVIGIQEATIWYCKKNLWSKKVEVFNFLDQFIAATKETGVGYSLASAKGVSAYNPGYKISAIPYLTKVTDPDTFPAIFGGSSASCGFTIADAILVRDDHVANVVKVGNTEYDASYSIIPTIMTIYRGYTWIDLVVAESKVRIVSTHLESIWDANKVPNAAKQADQLIADLSKSTMPIIVLGDFNSDPRDPRPAGDPNPGEQPVASDACPPSGDATCNAYTKMIDAGYANASPDAKDAKNFTWGATALLDGPDPLRVNDAKRFGNQYGFTDRLDYIFTKNVYANVSSKIIGNVYPDGNSIWDCGGKKCFATDHAGVVATIELPRGASTEDPALPDHARFPFGIWHFLAFALVTFVSWRIARRFRRS